LYQPSDHGFSLGGGSAALPLPGVPASRIGLGLPRQVARFGGRFADLDLTPDLGARIGSREWWRGFGTLTALCAAAIALAPGVDRPLPGAVPEVSREQWDEARAQSISPLAWGADTGGRMAATDLVRPLDEAPERPSIELNAAFGEGDSFRHVLERAGVGANEAAQVADMIEGAASADDVAAGTRLDIRLGRRPNKHVARPLDALAFRARFDLRLEVSRVNDALQLTRIPIRVDNTPLRVRGVVGDSLYRAARAAGAPAQAVETYLRAVGSKMSVGAIGSDARFDLIIAQRRAETGEVETGELLFAGIDQGRRKLQLLKWQAGGRTEWFDAAGVGEKRAGLTRPVSGRQTSGFGMRFHPLLGYNRFHKGIDFGGGYGAPIYAVSDGIATFVGRHGGHGNYVQLRHNGSMATGYAHMSRFAVRSGQSVRQGQVIGYVGSTGLSTGPHLHFEVYRNGQAINPRTVNFVSTSLLSGADLRAFRAKLASLLAVRAGD
jgi:murein DD-endopeptidase MepM/ murein hydrolase activator NlpD